MKRKMFLGLCMATFIAPVAMACLLYTSDAADEL